MKLYEEPIIDVFEFSDSVTANDITVSGNTVPHGAELVDAEKVKKIETSYTLLEFN